MDYPRTGFGYEDYLQHVINSHGLKVKSMITISSNQGIKEAVIQGMGLSLLSGAVIEREIKHKYLPSFNRKTAPLPERFPTFTRR